MEPMKSPSASCGSHGAMTYSGILLLPPDTTTALIPNAQIMPQTHATRNVRKLRLSGRTLRLSGPCHTHTISHWHTHTRGLCASPAHAHAHQRSHTDGLADKSTRTCYSRPRMQVGWWAVRLRSQALSCGTCPPVVKRGAHAQTHGSNSGGYGGKGEMHIGGT